MGKARLKLTYTQIRPFRQQQLIAQDNCCALCGDIIIDDAVLDHDHKTGIIRSVLHRGCNALLGKIENNMARNRVDIGRLTKISENLITYLTVDLNRDLLHPTYMTSEERAMKKKKKGRGRGRGR